MDLETALETIRRHCGPVSKTGRHNGLQWYYIIESSGEVYLPEDLIRLADKLETPKQSGSAQ